MTDTTGIVERLLELSFVSEGVARSRDEMGWDSVSYHRKRAESMKEAADTIERQQKEIASLTSQLEEARAKAIRECAKVADEIARTYCDENDDSDTAARVAAEWVASDIRALGGQK